MPYVLKTKQLNNFLYMKNFLLLSVFVVIIVGCTNINPEEKKEKSNAEKSIYLTISFQEIFDSNSVKGTFLLYDFKNDTTLVFNEDRTEKGFLPASTFKIINSMIALETEVIKDEEEIIKWDGQKRFAKAWNKDHSLRSGIKYSVVWFYQELARRIGEERMQYFVDTVWLWQSKYWRWYRSILVDR